MSVIATPYRYRESSSLPRREHLFGRHAVRKFVSVTAAAGGTGKTGLAMAEATAYAANRNLLDDYLVASGRSWYIGLEDPLEEYERRVGAILIHYGIEAADIEGRLFLDSGRDQNFVIAHESRGGIVIVEPVVAAITEQIQANEISHLTVDPFVACHRVGENDNMALEQVTRQWADIADKTGAAVELVHHIRKLGAGEELTADSARGAKALTDAARSVRVLVGMTEREATAFSVAERRRYFRVANVKANLYLPPDQATWRQLHTVSLGNGHGLSDDHIQVAAPWTAPRATDGISGAQVDQIIAKIGAGEYRASVQAKDWAGNAVAEVLGLDLSQDATKARVKGLIKLWTKTGALATERRPDGNREEREFVVPGTQSAAASAAPL